MGHRRTGKLIVASRDDEVPRLEALLAAAQENGVPEIALIDAGRLAQLEPAVSGVAALHSPATGIVDGHGLALSYLAEAEEHGAQLLVGHSVVALDREASGWRVVVRLAEGGDEQSLLCREVVNAAGLDAHRIAARAGIDLDRMRYRVHACKGEYFALTPGVPLALRQLIYPVGSAAAAGLGIHTTLDLGGRIRFGPNAHYVANDEGTLDYEVDDSRRGEFAEAVRHYLPQVEDEWLTPDFAGIRTKLAGPGEGFRDFVVAEESASGLAGLVSCIGIESPGLTASAAIAERIVALLDGASPAP